VTILEIKNVTKTFGGLYALSDLSLKIERGEIFGIAGPNGSGKTTLFNVIDGFYQGQGEVIFNNENISRLPPHKICRKGIARTFQIPNLFLTYPVIDNVRVAAHFGSKRKNNEAETIREAISLVGLEGKENIVTENLNLYDKKRTMIATALATKPQLLLIDEPIAGLSPTETSESVSLLKRINSKLNVTILIIEHRMKVLTELSERLMILDNGVQICIGHPEEVRQDERVIEIYLGGRHA